MRNKISSHTIFKSSKGYIALFSVIVLGAVGLVVTISLLLTGIGAQKSGLEVQRKSQSRMAATTCAEEALEQILDTGATSGTSSMTIGSSTCTYTITSTTTFPLVQALGNYGGSVTKINVILASSSPRIKLSSWQEVTDF